MPNAKKNLLRQCLALKPGERMLIISDNLLETGIAEYFVKEAKKITNRVQLVCINPTGGHGVEPPEKIAKIMAEYDVILLPTYYSLSHTRARKDACQKGARIASMPGITWDTIKRTLSIDYCPIAALSKKVASLLSRAKIAHLTSPSGCDLLFDLSSRRGIADTGLFTKPGDFGNLPAGEAFIAPVEGKTEGRLVFDKVYGDKKLKSPLVFEVKKGLAEPVASKDGPCSSAGSVLAEIQSELSYLGSKARNIAELGIGTNPAAALSGGLLELEKIYGSAHVALGNNIHFGGTVDVPYHVDGLILNPTLKLDGKIIIKHGHISV